MKLDSDNWVKLQNLAAIQNSSCTAIVDQLIDAYVNDKLPDNYEQRIEEQVYKTLDAKIAEHMLTRISELVAAKLGHSVDAAFSTDKTVDTVKKTKKTKTDQKVENEVIAIVKSVDTDNTDDTDKTEAEINIARFQRHRAASNKISRPDSYVAAQEGLSRNTIRRYRKGERSPKKPEFIEKWGLNWDGSAWCLN